MKRTVRLNNERYTVRPTPAGPRVYGRSGELDPRGALAQRVLLIAFADARQGR